MTGGGTDEHRGFVHRHDSHAVPKDDPLRPEPLPGRSFEVGEDLSGEGRMGLVLEGRDPSMGGDIRADPASEEDDPAETGSFEHRHRR